MSTTHVIQTVIEILTIIAIVVCMIYEPALARWERKQGEKMLRAFKKMRGYRK